MKLTNWTGQTMMTLDQALEVLAEHRGERVVVTTMSSVGLWPAKADSPRDFAYMPSSMGQGIPFALGLALAKPGLEVIVISGDGSLLMNLGCLVTLASHSVPVTVIVMDNGLYEVTGGQAVVGAGKVDYAGMARAAGISRVSSFEAIDSWRSGAGEALTGKEPGLIWLKILGEKGKTTPSPPRPPAEQIRRLREAIGATA